MSLTSSLHVGLGCLQAPAEMGSDSDAPPGLLFKHLGHNGKVVDFQWSAAEPWTMLSTDDGEVSGGSSLQVGEQRVA